MSGAATFRRTLPVRFADVDWARILYFPRQLDLLHTVMEDFFTEAWGTPYHRMLAEERLGFPTVHLECDFRSPLRFGDQLEVALVVRRIGTSSVTFRYEVRRAGGELAGEVTQVAVAIDPETWQVRELPAGLRAALARWLDPA